MLDPNLLKQLKTITGGALTEYVCTKLVETVRLHDMLKQVETNPGVRPCAGCGKPVVRKLRAVWNHAEAENKGEFDPGCGSCE